MADAQIPEGLTADYENSDVRAAIAALQETPDYAHLSALLLALREGFLIADVTGATSKKKGARVRTIRSTRGQLVLPLFTSMNELRAAHPANSRKEAKGVIVPAREALAIIESDRFVAAEFDKSTSALVILRKYLTLAISDQPITEDVLESMK